MSFVTPSMSVMRLIWIRNGKIIAVGQEPEPGTGVSLMAIRFLARISHQ
jgi:hypothetical protein